MLKSELPVIDPIQNPELIPHKITILIMRILWHN